MYLYCLRGITICLKTTKRGKKEGGREEGKEEKCNLKALSARAQYWKKVCVMKEYGRG